MACRNGEAELEFMESVQEVCAIVFHNLTFAKQFGDFFTCAEIVFQLAPQNPSNSCQTHERY